MRGQVGHLQHDMHSTTMDRLVEMCTTHFCTTGVAIVGVALWAFDRSAVTACLVRLAIVHHLVGVGAPPTPANARYVNLQRC